MVTRNGSKDVLQKMPRLDESNYLNLRKARLSQRIGSKFFVSRHLKRHATLQVPGPTPGGRKRIMVPLLNGKTSVKGKESLAFEERKRYKGIGSKL
jgi:hypothetical protein